jgi:hypothetical protein
MNRRGFLAALLAPVVARVLPKPKPIRRESLIRNALDTLKAGDVVTFAGVYAVNPWTLAMHREAFFIEYPYPYPKIGETITIRKPQRFTVKCHTTS